MSTDFQDTLAPPDSTNSTITFTRIFIHYLVRYRNIPVIAGEVNRGWSTVPWQHMANLYTKWRMKHVSVTLSIHCHQRCCKRSCQLSGSYSSTQHNNFNFNFNYFGTGIIRNVWPELNNCHIRTCTPVCKIVGHTPVLQVFSNPIEMLWHQLKDFLRAVVKP